MYCVSDNIAQANLVLCLQSRHNLSTAMPGTDLSAEEERLARKWRVKELLTPSEIAERLGRDKSTINRLFRRRAARKKRGRAQQAYRAASDKA